MWALALHGGVNTQKFISQEEQKEYHQSLEDALQTGIDVLKDGNSATDCVEAVVKCLEDFPLYNAGKGSSINIEGKHELEASIMNGNGECGSVIAVKNVKNPISLARCIMQDSSKPYIIFAGEGAERLADLYNVPKVENSYFFTQKRYDEWQRVHRVKSAVASELKKETGSLGTVGCAALDIHGHLCAGTSSGGMTYKPVGRVGHAPVIGPGTYANDETCAVSCTGRGEMLIRKVVAYDVHALMLYKGYSLQEATNHVIKKLTPGDEGIVSVDKSGEVSMCFSSGGLFRAGANAKGYYEVNIWN